MHRHFDFQRFSKIGARTLVVVAAGLMLTACSNVGNDLQLSLTGQSEQTGKDGKPLSDLDKAAAAYTSDPTDTDKIVAYADQLKQHDRKSDAMMLLQRANQNNSGDRRLLSAYGRLALDQGNLSLAKGLLEAADDPSKPDWRVLSARGTVLAKLGKHSESIAYYERARPLSNDHPSVVNNLALAYMMSGEPAKAEPLLRQAANADPKNVRVRQNLAMVLSLQGKYGEAKQLAAQDLSPESAAANAELLRTIVRLQEKPNSDPMTGWATDIASAPAKASSRGVETSSIRRSSPGIRPSL